MKTKWIEVSIILILLALVSICFAAWDNTKPADNSVWNNAAAEIRANWDALEVVFGVDLGDVSGTLDFNDIEIEDIKTNSPWIDVTHSDYGATGDGVTDDTAALQAAIDAATAYGVVVLPPGTYKFSQLKFYNPIYFMGLGSNAGRWNFTEAGVKLLCDESTDPAILIGGTSDSDITEAGGYVAEGITLANFLLYPATAPLGAAPGVGILVDGSTTLEANRYCARGIRFENVVVRDFGDENIKFLGGAFDIRFKGGGSFARHTTGILGVTAAYFPGGTSTPGQIYFYDFYSTAATGDWNYDGRFVLYGGGIAYGNGFNMGSGSGIFGTHIEGMAADPASIGLQLVGQYISVYSKYIASHDTAIIIGDGTVAVARHYFINTQISSATLGIHITDGASRLGSGVIYFSGTVTTDIQDDRSDTDGIDNELKILNDTRRIETIITLANEATPTVGDSMASGGIFLTGGVTTITDFDDGYPGQIITVLCKHSLSFDTTTAVDADHNLDGSSADITADTGDVLVWLCEDGTTWHLQSNNDASADNN